MSQLTNRCNTILKQKFQTNLYIELLSKKNYMDFRNHSGIYTLEVKQLLQVSIDKAWDFFSNPSNLEKLTPDNISFKTTSGNADKMYQGQIITYKIGILPLIKSNWVTEITTVKENSYFIDEQRFGPYKMWHHEHLFKANGNTTEMTDKISFALPFGFLGQIAYKLFVKKRLKEIFQFRGEVIGSLLN